MKKILLFGGLGVLGNEIVNHLKNKYSIIIIDVKSNSYFKKLKLNKNILYFKYSNYSQIKKFIRNINSML